MSKGIVIIALGYPLYGNAAFNLALSLKHTSPEIPIALVYEQQSISKLSKKELTFFDEFIKLDEKFYTINGSKQYQRSKLCVNLIGNKLGWAETMYMDADNLWFDKPVSELFEKLKNKEFHIGYNGDYNVITKQQTGLRYTYWALRNEKDICKYHGIEKTLPQTVSGFVYFKNGTEADDIFKKARETKPCLVFIDEADTIIKKRSHNESNSSSTEFASTICNFFCSIKSFNVEQPIRFTRLVIVAPIDPALIVDSTNKFSYSKS
mgnify:CR=1 FL=1